MKGYVRTFLVIPKKVKVLRLLYGPFTTSLLDGPKKGKQKNLRNTNPQLIVHRLTPTVYLTFTNDSSSPPYSSFFIPDFVGPYVWCFNSRFSFFIVRLDQQVKTTSLKQVMCVPQSPLPSLWWTQSLWRVRRSLVQTREIKNLSIPLQDLEGLFSNPRN